MIHFIIICYTLYMMNVFFNRKDDASFATKRDFYVFIGLFYINLPWILSWF